MKTFPNLEVLCSGWRYRIQFGDGVGSGESLRCVFMSDTARMAFCSVQMLIIPFYSAFLSFKFVGKEELEGRHI